MSLDNYCWTLAAFALNDPSADVIHFTGLPGVGKSYAAQRVGLGARECVNLTLTSETVADSLVGFHHVEGGDFVWRDGPVVQAMKKGARLILNEVSHASSDVIDVLHAVTESAETASLTLLNAEREVVRPAPGFEVVYTDNLGVDALPEALQSRIKARVFIDVPHPDGVARIDERYRVIAERGFEIDAKGESETDQRVSLREWIRLSDMWRSAAIDESNERMAFELTLGRERGLPVFEAMKLDDLK